MGFIRLLPFVLAWPIDAMAKDLPFPVRCGPSESCPQAVGLWVQPIPKGKMPDQCTVFLIDRDLALTNHHCIPKASRKAGAPCDGSRLYFPKVPGRSADSASCKEVVALSSTSDRIDEPDWALVRLQHPLDRMPLAIDRSGLADLDTVRAWVAEPEWASIAVRNLPSAEIRSVDCVVSRRTNIFHDPGSRADFTDPLSRKVPLASCPTWKGNSGSPALVRRADGIWAARAILDRSAPTQALKSAVARNSFPLLDTALGDFAFATNLACLHWPDSSAVPAACRTDSSPQAIARDQKKVRDEVDSAIRVQIRKIAGWRLQGRVLQAGVWPHFEKAIGPRPRPPDALVVPLPDCGPALPDTSWSAPVWSMRFGYDRDLRWTFRMEREDSAFRVHAKCKGKDANRICEFEGFFRAGPLPLRTDTIPRCPDRVAGGPA